MYELKPVPLMLKPTPFSLQPMPFKLTRYLFHFPVDILPIREQFICRKATGRGPLSYGMDARCNEPIRFAVSQAAFGCRS